jgi:hypothetical protein
MKKIPVVFLVLYLSAVTIPTKANDDEVIIITPIDVVVDSELFYKMGASMVAEAEVCPDDNNFINVTLPRLFLDKEFNNAYMSVYELNNSVLGVNLASQNGRKINIRICAHPSQYSNVKLSAYYASGGKAIRYQFIGLENFVN